MVRPTNLVDRLTCDFKNIKINPNDHLNILLSINRAYRELYTELEYLYGVYHTSSPSWDMVYFETGENVNLEKFNKIISTLYEFQIELKEDIEGSTYTLTLPYESDSLVIDTLKIFKDEFVCSDIINRPIYRIYKNNKQLARWIENYSIFGQP